MDLLDLEIQVRNLLSQLSPGESVELPGRGGWEMKVIATDDGFDFEHRHIAGNGMYKFFTYRTTGNPYGAGKIVQEPTLSVSFANAGIHIEVAPKTELSGRIIGAIVLDADGKVVGRFSWSNVVFAQKNNFSISHDGELVVDGISYGFVHAVFLPDKNRLDGYVGVFKPTKPGAVRVLEMETLLFASL